jgi:hypothetical protein
MIELICHIALKLLALLLSTLVVLAGIACNVRPAAAAEVAGRASVVSQDGSVHGYSAFRLLAGDVHDGMLADASLDGCAGSAVLASLGAPSDAKRLAAWLAEGAATDAEGTFSTSIVRAVQASGAAPAATFSSGETVELGEGYWIIASGDARPMLWLVDDAEPIEAVEKSVDRGEPPIDTEDHRRPSDIPP